ncbi:PREDICTED: uncharacterized protein PB18E9.04c-like [Amphimedon queenslandica]|uniref:Uncharacterized protein n=1 Tax=Amphimedon queenslandica TaxID=400682 RepID=A0A1X7VDB7_AMPQE|nr:PREDICTED: uncharacterized protein PB18E9.04c-like [Amphimedon queenslandica]|eukprot:XP_003384834.1 PREDICTED: uncharacterized protein PB18E9.04c-like [Amphimedon queenslandica]
MATEAATGQPANVQAYLGKHKIQTLFEDLTSLLVKDLPDNPIDFLIQKLQAKKKKVTSATGRTSSSKSIDTTGAASPKTERSKPPTKPATGKPAAGASKLPSRPITAPSKTTASKPASSGPASSKSATSVSKPSAGSKTTAGSKTAPPSGSLKKPTGGAGGASKPATGTGPPGKTTTAAKTSAGAGGTPKRPVSSSSKSSTSGTSAKGTSTPTGKTASKLQKPATTRTPPTNRKPVAKPVAKVTEAPPPESTPKDDESEKVMVSDGGGGGDDEDIPVITTVPATGEDESEEEGEEGGHFESKNDLNVDDLISKIKKSKQPKNCKAHLVVPIKAHPSSSEGYISESDGDEDELEVVENAAELEEEGVILTGDAKKLSLKMPEVGPSVDLQVLICARCSKIISQGEDYSTISSSKLTSIDEFESASQVGGTSTNSQWGSEESGGAPVTLKQKWAMSKPIVADTSSEVTSTTQDTWKGVEPIPRPDVTSEEESELKLPDPVDYEKPLGDTTEEEPTSLINFED